MNICSFSEFIFYFTFSGRCFNLINSCTLCAYTEMRDLSLSVRTNEINKTWLQWEYTLALNRVFHAFLHQKLKRNYFKASPKFTLWRIFTVLILNLSAMSSEISYLHHLIPCHAFSSSYYFFSLLFIWAEWNYTSLIHLKLSSTLYFFLA